MEGKFDERLNVKTCFIPKTEGPRKIAEFRFIIYVISAINHIKSYLLDIEKGSLLTIIGNTISLCCGKVNIRQYPHCAGDLPWPPG